MASKSFEFRYNKNIGVEESLKKLLAGADMRGRRVGTSTGQALEFIGALMQNPGIEMPVPYDHHTRTEEMRRVMAARVSGLIKTLGLVGFDGSTDRSFMYSPTGIARIVVLPE